MKQSILKIVSASVFLISCAMAAPSNNSPQTGIQMQAAGQINCQKHRTDVCIANYTSQTVSFLIPSLGINHKQYLYPPPPPSRFDWVDASSSALYQQINVIIFNANNQIIFDQPVYNHSVIKITNYTSMITNSGSTQLNVTVAQ